MENKTSPVFTYIFAGIGIFATFCFIVEYFKKDAPLDYNPRHAVNGIDTVYTKDSIYTIQVQIKNVEPEPPDEPQDYR